MFINQDPNWQEVDGEVLPPEVEPQISAQQPYINDSELRQDHAEIAAPTRNERNELDLDRPWRLSPEEKAIGRAGVKMARAVLRATLKQQQ